MLKRGFLNVFSHRTFATNPEFNIACKTLKLSTDVQIVFSAITHLSKKEGFSWASQAYLAKEIGRTTRTVRNHIAKLKKLGLVTVQQRNNGQTAIYTPLPVKDVVEQLKKICSEIGKVCLETTDKVSSLLYKENNTSVNPPKSPKGGVVGDDANAFEKLWEQWPVKQAKKSARRVFMRLLRNGSMPSVEDLLKKISNLRRHDKAWLKGKMPLLANWLRGERWNDVCFNEETMSTSAPVRTTAPAEPAKKATEEDSDIARQYGSLSVAIVLNRKPDVDDTTLRVIEAWGGLKKLKQEGIEKLSVHSFTEKYKELRG